MRWLALLVAFFLSACATTVSRDSVGSLRTESLCVNYGRALRENASAEQLQVMRDEMARRGYQMGATEDDLIRRERMRVGMSICAMHASWGPSTVDNGTTTAYGRRVQHVFGLRGKRNYVYTEGGVVVAIQN